MLKIENLTKKYRKNIALQDVSLNVEAGFITVLLGPNGAGKSTLMKCVIGILRHDGVITIDGKEHKSIDAKKVFSYVPETPQLYDLLTIDEHLEFVARAYGISEYKTYMETYIKRFNMLEHRDKTIKEMSKGMRQKVSICCALLIHPKIILFDEPMIGLDPAAIRELKLIFQELKETGTAVFISTHIIDSIKEQWDKAYILDHGLLKDSTTREGLTDKKLEDLFYDVTGVTE